MEQLRRDLAEAKIAVSDLGRSNEREAELNKVLEAMRDDVAARYAILHTAIVVTDV